MGSFEIFGKNEEVAGSKIRPVRGVRKYSDIFTV